MGTAGKRQGQKDPWGCVPFRVEEAASPHPDAATWSLRWLVPFWAGDGDVPTQKTPYPEGAASYSGREGRMQGLETGCQKNNKASTGSDAGAPSERCHPRGCSRALTRTTLQQSLGGVPSQHLQNLIVRLKTHLGQDAYERSTRVKVMGESWDGCWGPCMVEMLDPEGMEPPPRCRTRLIPAGMEFAVSIPSGSPASFSKGQVSAPPSELPPWGFFGSIDSSLQNHARSCSAPPPSLLAAPAYLQAVSSAGPGPRSPPRFSATGITASPSPSPCPTWGSGCPAVGMARSGQVAFPLSQLGWVPTMG